MLKGEWWLHSDGIRGWASFTERQEPLWLELVADGEPMGICRADLPEPNGCGFWMPVPNALLDEGCELAIRAANTNQLVPGLAAKRAHAAPALVGELMIDRGGVISGWLADAERSDHKLKLAACINGQKVAETVAAERRYRPASADGHGFTLCLPPEFGDGESHVVTIHDEFGREAPGSPVRVRWMPQNAAAWLDSIKKPERPLLRMLSGMLQNMEDRLPGIMGSADFMAWKKTFPPTAPKGRLKAAIGFLHGEAPDPKLLRGQLGLEAKLRQDNPDFYYTSGGATQRHPYLLGRMVEALRETGAALIYADGESLDGQPLLKPAWDQAAFLARDFHGPMLIAASAVALADIAPQDDPTQARLKAAMAASCAGGALHLPELLSTHALSSANPSRDAIVDAWLRANLPGASYGDGRLRYSLPRKPMISIIIPTRDHGDLLKTCLDSLRQTDWPAYEIIVVDNGTAEEEALAVMRSAAEDARVCILRRPGVFNYADLNNCAAAGAKGELLCFLNNDTEALHPDWLAELAAPLLAAGDSGGCSGAKLAWPNGLCQHSGVVIGTHQLAAHVGNHWLVDEPGHLGRNLFTQQYSAVTAACMLTPKVLFNELGGFDARRFPIAFNDVDYCLRLRGQGKKVFWTPHALLTHHESASRGEDAAGSAKSRSEREMACFRTRWGHYDDPFYNPNLPLSVACEPFQGLALPPRPRAPR